MTNQILGDEVLADDIKTRENYNPFNPYMCMSDQDRISPKNINTMISSGKVMRIKKLNIRKLLVDPIPNSPN